MISIKDLREKTFSQSLRGYNADEVDDFLDELATQFEELIRENQRLQKAAESAPAAPASPVAVVAAPAPVQEQPQDSGSYNEPQYFKNLEQTLRETLQSAQRIADDTVAEARKKANQMVAAAEEKAADIESKAKLEAETARAEGEELKKAADDYRAKFMRLLQEQLHVLKTDESIFGAADEGKKEA